MPNINQRSASTTAELGDGQSIAIAGLYRNSATKHPNRLPPQGHPHLGAPSFRPTHETERSVTLIIVVTAHLVAPLNMR